MCKQSVADLLFEALRRRLVLSLLQKFYMLVMWVTHYTVFVNEVCVDSTNLCTTVMCQVEHLVVSSISS